jgi:hypothetical protein
MERHVGELVEGLSEDVRLVSSRSRLAALGLGLIAALHVYSLVVRWWRGDILQQLVHSAAPAHDSIVLSRHLVNAGVYGGVALQLIVAVAFLSWLHALIRVANRLGAEVGFSPGQAVGSFFIPFVNLLRPYSVMTDVHGALAPELVSEPSNLARADQADGYRSITPTPAEPQVALPNAFVGVWWGTYLAMFLVSRAAAANFSSEGRAIDQAIFTNNTMMVSNLFALISAAVAVRMVRAVSARLLERHRRVRYSSLEDLRYDGIVVS